jgi:hypothetical protein
MLGRAWAALGLLGLAACAEIGAEPLPNVLRSTPVAPEDLELASVNASYQRAFERAYTEEPFAAGAMAVIAEEAGELRTFDLVPCQGGQAICSGASAGQLWRSPDWWVVKGLHGRIFWLSYGGDGYLERNGTLIPLAWNARANGTGPGTEPSLETPFRHTGPGTEP